MGEKDELRIREIRKIDEQKYEKTSQKGTETETAVKRYIQTQGIPLKSTLVGLICRSP